MIDLELEFGNRLSLTPCCLFMASEKALMECAFELHAELENAASDVSELFAKIGSRKLVDVL